MYETLKKLNESINNNNNNDKTSIVLQVKR